MNAAKRERVEDIGIIYERLRVQLEDFEGDYPYFDSKHSYESFQGNMLANDCDKLEDFHRRMRWLIEQLNEILYIAQGEIE